MILARAARIGRGLQLWRLRAARAAALAPGTVVTALSAIAVLLVHRLSAGCGRGSLLAARPVEERHTGRSARAAAEAVERAA